MGEEQQITEMQQERLHLLMKQEALQMQLQKSLKLDTHLLDEFTGEREHLIEQNKSLKMECQEVEERVACENVLSREHSAEIKLRHSQTEMDNLQLKEFTEAYQQHESGIVKELKDENYMLKLHQDIIKLELNQ